jgi:hypothetical protein
MPVFLTQKISGWRDPPELSQHENIRLPFSSAQSDTLSSYIHFEVLVLP